MSTFDPLSDPDPVTGRVGEPGQAERAAEVQRKIDQMLDPADPYNGEHEEEGPGE